MRKIAIVADLHLNNNSYGKVMDDGLPLKIHDNIVALRFFVSQCLAKRVDRVVIVGDLYENSAPTSKIRRLLNAEIQQLIDHKIEVFALVGNHDICMEHHALEPMKGWNERLKIVEEAGSEIIDNGSMNQIAFIYIPHTKEIENKKYTFRDYVSKIQSKISVLKDKRIILFGHFPVAGAMMNDHCVNKDDRNVSVEDLVSLNLEACFLGDYHKRQKLSKEGNIWYVGDLERQNFSEENQEKGFCIYDLDTRDLEWINYPARKMITISGNDAEEILSKIESSDLSDAVVKVKVAGNEEEYFEVQQKFNEIASSIKKKGAIFFVGLEKPKKEEKDTPAIQIDIPETSDKIDAYKIIELEIKKLLANDEPEVQVMIGLLTEIQKQVQLSSQFSANPSISGKKTIKFKWIRYHNFCRFGEIDNVLDFNKLFSDSNDNMAGIASVMGCIDLNEDEANGAGKSALFEGIPYALYEKMPRLSSVRNKEKRTTTEMIRTDDFGNYACKEAFVELCMDVEGVEWVVKRGRKLTGKGSHTAILELKKDGQPFDSRKLKDPNRIIIDLIGMDFEPFCNSTFFAQKDTSKLFTLTPKGRIDTVLNVLGVLKDVDDALEFIREEKKKKNKERILQLEGKVEVLRDIADQNEDQIVSNLEKSKVKLKTCESEITDKEKLYLETQATKNSLVTNKEVLKEKKRGIESDVSQFSNKKLQQINPIKQEIKVLKDKIQAEEMKDAEFFKNKEALRTEYNKQQEIIKSVNVDECNKRLSEIEDGKKKLALLEPERKQLLSEITTKISDKSRLQGKAESIKVGIEKYNQVLNSSKAVDLSDVKSDIIQCPYCGSGKPRYDLMRSVDKLKEDFDFILSEIEKTNKQISELRTKEGQVDLEMINLRKLINEESSISVKLTKLEVANEQIEKLAERAKEMQRSYKASKGESVDCLNKKIEENNKKIESVEISFVEEEEKLKKVLVEVEDQIVNTALTIRKREEEMNLLSSAISLRRKDKEKLISDIRSYEDTLKRIEKGKKDLEESKKLLEEEYKLQKRINVLETMFSSDGVRTQIVNIYLPIFNKHLADFLSILTNGRMYVKLEVKTMEPKITGGSSSIYEMLSGGEQDVIRLAANLALGMVSLGSSRSLPETLFLDEIFGSFAPAMQERVFELLKYLRMYFKRILVITHNPELQDRFSKIVKVQKNGGISSISVE